MKGNGDNASATNDAQGGAAMHPNTTSYCGTYGGTAVDQVIADLSYLTHDELLKVADAAKAALESAKQAKRTKLELRLKLANKKAQQARTAYDAAYDAYQAALDVVDSVNGALIELDTV